jgi:predicted amidohydrolase YtcJ
MLLEQPFPSAEGGQTVGITADYMMAAQAGERPLNFQIQKGDINGCIVRVYSVSGQDIQLIHEEEHYGTAGTDGSKSLAFSVILSASSLTTAKATTPPTSPPVEAASIIFYNGQVVTMDASMIQAEALAVKGENILAVGSDAEILTYQGSATIMIDLDGKALLPGFIDGHTHVLRSPDIVGLTMDDAMEVALSYGLTGVTEMVGEADFIEQLQRADQEGRMRLRVNLFTNYNQGYLDDQNQVILVENPWFSDHGPILDHDLKVRVPGIKVFVDGGDPGRGCPALTEPYPKEFQQILPPVCIPNGTLYFTQAELNQIVADIQAKGFRVAFHSMGDRGIDTVLNAIENALGGESNDSHRHAVQHNSLLRPDQLTRYEQIRPLASVRGYFNTCDQEGYPDFYGPYRYEWAANRYALPNMNIHAYAEGDFGWTTEHTDRTAPRTLNPLLYLYGLVTHKQLRDDGTVCEPAPWLARHVISVEKALRMFTTETAYAVSQEDYLGSLEPGKFADMIILSDNPLTVNPDDLKDLDVWMTMVGGSTEYCAPGQEDYCP